MLGQFPFVNKIVGIFSDNVFKHDGKEEYQSKKKSPKIIWNAFSGKQIKETGTADQNCYGDVVKRDNNFF